MKQLLLEHLFGRLIISLYLRYSYFYFSFQFLSLSMFYSSVLFSIVYDELASIRDFPAKILLTKVHCALKGIFHNDLAYRLEISKVLRIFKC